MAMDSRKVFYHLIDCEDYCLLGCDVVYFDRWIKTSCRFLRGIGKSLPKYTASHSRKQSSKRPKYYSPLLGTSFRII